jgi:FkbM family methyltransferase
MRRNSESQGAGASPQQGTRLLDRLKVGAASALEIVLRTGRRSHYSQFGEDALLQSYFDSKIARGERGFYVDIGAFAPITFSNTFWFYQRAWRGINVDAAPGSMRAFRVARPRDVNLECAVSSMEGSVTFYQLGARSVLNTVSRDQAHRVAAAENLQVREVTVPSRRLSAILEQHVPPGQRIDFLSVDVEGHDLEVLRSNDWERFSPELVLVEVHGKEIEPVLASAAVADMRAWGYTVHAWVPPTVFFRRATGPELVAWP